MTQQRSGTRRGAIAVVFVLTLAVLVSTFASIVVSKAANERRSDADRNLTSLLESALESVLDADLPEGSYRLSVDESNDRYIVVEFLEDPGSPARWRATSWHREQPGRSIVRSVPQ